MARKYKQNRRSRAGKTRYDIYKEQYQRRAKYIKRFGASMLTPMYSEEEFKLQDLAIKNTVKGTNRIDALVDEQSTMQNRKSIARVLKQSGVKLSPYERAKLLYSQEAEVSLMEALVRAPNQEVIEDVGLDINDYIGENGAGFWEYIADVKKTKKERDKKTNAEANAYIRQVVFGSPVR